VLWWLLRRSFSLVVQLALDLCLVYLYLRWKWAEMRLRWILRRTHPRRFR
jgi:hypothetical protein